MDVVLRQRFTAADPSGATLALQAVLGAGAVAASTGPFRYDQISLVDDGISVTRITSSGTAVRIVTTNSPDLVVCAVRQGTLVLRRDGDEVTLGTDELGIIPMGTSADLEWTGVTVDVYAFPMSALNRVLGAAGQAVSLRRARLTPQSTELKDLWNALAHVVAGRMLDKPDLYDRELVRTQLIDALAASTVEAFALSNRSDDDRGRDADVLTRAEAFIHAHLGDPIGVPDIANAAEISVRGLQIVFKRSLDTTPIAFLRGTRLAAAREALRSAGRSTTVGEIARRFGYSNLGRFSAHYREAWDETPSQTLQGARART